MKVLDVAKKLALEAGKDWDKMDEMDKNIFKNIATGVMMLSSDVDKIEKWKQIRTCRASLNSS